MARATRTAVALACALAVSIMPAPAFAARATLTRVGRQPVLGAHATVVGLVAPKATLHITVALKPRDAAALATYARAVSTFGSPVYHHYLRPRQFARRFGATRAEIAVVARGLRARGLRLGRVSAGSLSIPVVASVAQVERSLNISLRRLALRGGHIASAANAAPAVPARAARAIEAILGLDSISAPRPLLVRPAIDVRVRSPIDVSARRGVTRVSARGAPARTHAANPDPEPCASARAVAQAQGAHTADQIAAAYGLSALYNAGDRGSGTTVAVYELEPVRPTDIASYQSCYGTHTSITYVPVDGGAGSGAGSGEAALDIEDLLGLAPDAKLIVYQGQNSNSGAPGSGPYDTFSAIVNQDRAQVVSVSWGGCEAALGAGAAAAENTLFEQAAVQGQTIIAASGDNGSEDCLGTTPQQTQLAVDDPSSQPFVTGVGGTTLSAIGPRPTESVWNSRLGPSTALVQPGAGGGGISDLWGMPAGQFDASPALNVLGAGITGGQCGHPGGYCREVPDVSADADPTTGYVFYWNGTGTDDGGPPGWQAIGGTSGAAPVWAAVMALADASRACDQGPVGYAVPALYRAAGSSYAADFNDVLTGDNDYTATNGGEFAAGVGYDEASGLGSPNAPALVNSLCGATLRVDAPRAQRSAVGGDVSLALHAHDVAGASVRFQVIGLPPGLSANPVTGSITGRPVRSGVYRVTAIAQDGQAARASATFSWSVGGATRLVDFGLTGLTNGRPRLSFTILAGRGAPPVRTLLVSVPKPLQLVSDARVRVSARGRARFVARLRQGTLAIELARGFRRVRVTLLPGTLRASGERHPNTSGRHPSELTVTVFVGGNGTSRLHARV
jgi:hypothetical protein